MDLLLSIALEALFEGRHINFTIAFMFQVHNKSTVHSFPSPRLPLEWCPLDYPKRLKRKGMSGNTANIPLPVSFPLRNSVIMQKSATITTQLSAQNNSICISSTTSSSILPYSPVWRKIWYLLNIQLRSPHTSFDLLEQNSNYLFLPEEPFIHSYWALSNDSIHT